MDERLLLASLPCILQGTYIYLGFFPLSFFFALLSFAQRAVFLCFKFSFQPLPPTLYAKHSWKPGHFSNNQQ